MDLRHLRYFAAVAEERHFGRAAERLRMAQPPLSRQIQALEKELGFSLLARSRRHVELTPAGTVFLEHTRRVFAELDRGVREARRASVGESGRITVGYLSSLAYSGLTRLLRAFRGRFPAVEVALREFSPAHQIEALKEGSIDVGFVRGPIADPTLAFEVVRRESLLVALPSDHTLAGRNRVHLSALATEPFVSVPRARVAAFFDTILAMCRQAGFTPRIVQDGAAASTSLAWSPQVSAWRSSRSRFARCTARTSSSFRSSASSYRIYRRLERGATPRCPSLEGISGSHSGDGRRTLLPKSDESDAYNAEIASETAFTNQSRARWRSTGRQSKLF